MALYTFGGGGSGAAMRLSGCARCDEETNGAPIQNPFDEPSVPSAIVVPQDVIAMQHGVAAVLHGFDCSLLCEGDS
jgi:hypothetical protein